MRGRAAARDGNGIRVCEGAFSLFSSAWSMLGVVRVLVVEDDEKLGSVLVRGFATDGIVADLVTRGRDALVRAGATEYTVIVLDVMLPDLDGFSVCRSLRKEKVFAPVLMLTARDAVEDRVRGLDSGADDYVVKPFSFAELLARVRALSRRGAIERTVMLEVGDLRLDSARHQVWRGETPIDLAGKEYAVLEALMRHPGDVLSRFQLLEAVWGYEYENRSNIVEVYVRYLREKIDRPFGRQSLQTVRGVGYRVCAE
jgi:two-component system OmpR family response regulator